SIRSARPPTPTGAWSAASISARSCSRPAGRAEASESREDQPRRFRRLLGAQLLGDRVRMRGLAEEIALHLVAAAAQQEPLLRGGLDAFGDDRDAQRPAYGDDGLDDRLVLDVVRDLEDERAVDLQRIDRETFELRERRVARAEIVDREPDAQLLDREQLLHCAV